MKVALIMNHNAYAGREYMASLIKHGVVFDVISIGFHPATSSIEEERCQGLWQPPPFERLVKGQKHFNFDSLQDVRLHTLLEQRKYDLGIQGGTGILKKPVLDAFLLGILNFHPGDLPAYRGCSAPEWQLYERRPVISTCHLVDSGIDSGPIYAKRRLNVDYTDYRHFRASIYPRTSEFVVDIVREIIDHNGFFRQLVGQEETEALYRKYIGPEKIGAITNSFERYRGISMNGASGEPT